MDWTETNSYIRGIINKLDDLPDPTRVASFDLDDTLIHRPRDAKRLGSKWKLIDTSIIDKIEDLVKKKYIIIIFTNQGGMGLNKNFDKPKWRRAVDDLCKILTKKVNKYYFAVYVSKNYDLYRKPNIGLWQQMKIDLCDEFELNKIRISKKSFFVGDAAGRIKPSPFKKKISPTSHSGDFSDVDRKFALNIGINFMTPEEFFMTNLASALRGSELLDEEPPQMEYKLSGINSKKMIESAKKNKYIFEPRSKEMVVMVGLPGSGKTEFVKKYILPHGYVHISLDICKSKPQCLSQTKKALEKKKSVVIDNTNPDVLSRMTYTSLAQECGYKHIRCIIMNTDIEIAKHLNNVRHVYSNGMIPKISNIVYNIFKKNYVKPQKSEHFDKIETVDFMFDKENLNDPVWKKIFMRWSE